MLGVPISKSLLMVGDNMSVILNTTVPSSSLKNKHLGCTYNCVQEAIAAGIIDFGHVASEENVADIFTKPLPAATFHNLTKKYLFRRPKASTVEESQDQKETSMIEGE